MLLYCVAASTWRAQAVPLVPERTSSSKAIPERFQGASIADHLLNQRLFWSAMMWFPGLKASAILSSPFERLEHARENIQTPAGAASNSPPALFAPGILELDLFFPMRARIT